MAQKRLLLGHVKGDPGPAGEAGRDGNISSATGTVAPGHLDEPTVTVQMGGEPGAQTMEFSFAGLQGADGKDGAAAAIGTITAEVDDSTGVPEVEVTTEGGYEKDVKFSFKNLKGKDGAAGPAGASAGFGTITVTVDGSSEGEPSCDASWEGDDASKNLTLAFKNLKGDKGDAGSDYEPQGTRSQVLLGDGTAKDISALISENAEAIREALGLATTEHMGLVPQLPEAEE